MIPDIYFEDPFPINVPAEYLSDCWITEGSNHDHNEWITTWQKAMEDNPDPEDVEELRVLYGEMVHFYMECNFKEREGTFAIIHDAFNIIKASGDDGNIRNFFKEYRIDFSHLFGNVKMDVQIVIVPFDDIEKLLEMKSKIKLSNAIEVWQDGSLVEDTL